MKALAVTETLLIIGMCALAALLFVKIPGEINDLKKLLAISSANTVAKDIAGLLTTTAIAPNNISLNYSLPTEAVYDISFENYTVYVNASWEELVRVENSSAKTLVNLSAYFEDVEILNIYKFVYRNQNFWGAKEYE